MERAEVREQAGAPQVVEARTALQHLDGTQVPLLGLFVGAGLSDLVVGRGPQRRAGGVHGHVRTSAINVVIDSVRRPRGTIRIEHLEFELTALDPHHHEIAGSTHCDRSILLDSVIY